MQKAFFRKIRYSQAICPFFKRFGGHIVNLIERYSKLDQHDVRIIDALVKEGRLAVTDLAKRVGLSKSPCQVRLKRLLERVIF